MTFTQQPAPLSPARPAESVSTSLDRCSNVATVLLPTRVPSASKNPKSSKDLVLMDGEGPPRRAGPRSTMDIAVV
jgi:hypothetical protein